MPPPRIQVAAALAGAIALAACAGGSGSLPKVVSVAAVAHATQAQHTARMQLRLTYGSKEVRSTVSEGVVNFDTGDETAKVRAAPGGKGTAVVLAVGREVFVGSTAPPRAGPQWVQFSFADAASATTGLTFDPIGFTTELEAAATSFSEDGSSRVHGDSTRTYRLDLRSGSQVLTMMMVPSTTSATASMDVDRSGRLRRLVVEPDHPTTSPERHDGGGLKFPAPARSALELWDSGVKVDVRTPRPDKVVQLTDPRAGELLGPIFKSMGLAQDYRAHP